MPNVRDKELGLELSKVVDRREFVVLLKLF
jgi:hypothetical protein